MVGQSSLKSQINRFTTDNLPQTILICGQRGCGKDLFYEEYVSPLLCKPSRDITSDISFELLFDLSDIKEPYTYTINLDDIQSKKQNVLLKFIEEPPTNSTVVLFSSRPEGLLPTIMNRCYVFRFSQYSKAELSTFTTSEKILKYCSTPGDVLSSSEGQIDAIHDLCEKLFTKNKQASMANMLKVSDKVDFTGKQSDLFDSKMFYDILIDTCLDLYRARTVSKPVYDITLKFVNEARGPIQFDRKRMFEKYLVELKFGKL